MSDLMEFLKPQLDAQRSMYEAGYTAGLAEGKRQAFAEMKKVLAESTVVANAH